MQKSDILRMEAHFLVTYENWKDDRKFSRFKKNPSFTSGVY